VHKVSIVGRGFGVLGYTLHLPTEERYLSTRRQLQGELAVLLGGRTAEEIALGEISTGAQNDLQRASDMARSMVTEWGMSEAMGAINYDVNKRARFLDIGMPQERGLYSEQTAQQIDGEIRRILTEAHDTARRILTERRSELDVIAKRLLEIEVIENDELHRLLGLPLRQPAAAPAAVPPPPIVP
jgi:cell division protease FtsH